MADFGWIECKCGHACRWDHKLHDEKRVRNPKLDCTPAEKIDREGRLDEH
jgi:hypothetical protein